MAAMISFCVIKAGSRSDYAAQAVIDYVRNQFGEANVHFDTLRFEDEGMYFLGIRPTLETSAVNASCFVDDRVITCFYGETDHGHVEPAKHVARIYESAGVSGLADIDGCYGTVLYDRVSKEAVLGGDAIGQRCLHYVLQDNLLLVSPHDILLAATGLIPITVDPISFAAIGLFGWSVGDASLIEAIRSAPPGGLVVLRKDASPYLLPHPFFRACEQKRGSVAEILAIRERIIEALRGYLARRLAHAPRILAELSAGFDSRASLALALSVVGRDRIDSISSGTPRSTDVRIGRKVARRIGIAHRGGLPAESSAEEYHGYVETMALETNGDANALVVMTKPVAPLVPRLGGEGGEIFRGYYYPLSQAVDHAPATGAKMASAFWKRSKRSRIGLRPEIERGLKKRVAERAAWIAGLAASESDGLDLLYILERFAVWNKKVRRVSSTFNRLGPFCSRTAIRLFLTLPAPRGRHALLHQTLIQRYAFETLSIPINGVYRLNLQLGNAFQRKLGRAFVVLERIRRRFAGRLPKVWHKGVTDLDQLRGQSFQSLLAERYAKLLIAEESGSIAAFGHEALEKLLIEIGANDPVAVQTAGAFLSDVLFVGL
jgi:hypothetical protein